jgi:DNA uptake protein ComE-like DNA-binding protein
MRNRFFHYLHFTRKERNGTIVLLLLCALIFATPEILSRFKSPEGTDFTGFRKEIQTFRDSLNSRKSSHATELFYFNPNTASEEDFVRLGLSQKTAAMICKYRDKGGQFRRPEDFKKIWGLAPEDYERLAPFIRMENEGRDFPEKQFAGRHPAETFQFDPNTATEEDFQRLGLPKWTVKSILNYRSKGGKFRRKEDFQKIYNLPEEDYARLESFIAIQPSAAFAQTASYPAATGFPSKKTATRSVDINRADVEAWMTLPGIGEKRARQLINYRDKLGGFLSVEQVAQMYNLPDSVFQSIRPLLVLESREIRKIDLNSASAADLDAHPYFSKKQADLIVNYRQQHGPYRSVDDIDRIIPFTDKVWLAKVKAYLRV